VSELLFSVTAKDCDWSYTKGTGSGGQKKNKTSSAVHCMHRPSGASGYSESSRSQSKNKSDAFVKMCNTDEFRQWHHRETLKKNGQMKQIDDYVESQMKKIKIEIKIDGKWTETDAI
jgi:protein subunit release factor B